MSKADGVSDLKKYKNPEKMELHLLTILLILIRIAGDIRKLDQPDSV